MTHGFHVAFAALFGLALVALAVTVVFLVPRGAGRAGEAALDLERADLLMREAA